MKPGVWLPGASLPAVTRGAEVPQWLRVMSSARSQHQMPQSWRWRGGGGLLACTSRSQGTRRRDASKGSPARQVCLCRFPLHVPALTLAPRDPREGSEPQPALPLPTFPGKGRELQAPWGGGTAKVARADHAEFHRMTTCLLRPGEPCQALALCSAERRRAWAAR